MIWEEGSSMHTASSLGTTCGWYAVSVWLATTSYKCATGSTYFAATGSTATCGYKHRSFRLFPP
ncbi:MAG: hypothetical protein R2792_14105 [Saprospiraceae bacterium]